MRIQDIMSTPVVTCRPTETLDHAARLMWDDDCGALPVVDEEGRITGILTDRDVCMAAYTTGRALREIPVSVAMAREVFSCRPGDSVVAAERLMSAKQIRRLPVLDDDRRPLGMISLGDIARCTVRGDDGDQDVVRSLAEISRPRHQEIQVLSDAPAGWSPALEPPVKRPPGKRRSPRAGA